MKWLLIVKVTATTTIIIRSEGLLMIFLARLDDASEKESDKKAREEMLKTANMRQGALYSVNSRSSFPNLNSQMPIDGFSSTRDASSWQRYHLLRVAAYKLGMEERNRKLEVIFLFHKLKISCC